MPLAGPEASARAAAHIRWAARYDADGNVSKAAAHFGRAVHYARFGADTATPSDDSVAASIMIDDTADIDAGLSCYE